ncbi:hypothetical protein A1O3_08305 [Capronia epimyces CBS 606.96]|uniref:Heterokaryon incompatibility domain-containing protein n=1 Tax=Capronia epimyces CBS 606.96 TaxID=1182542 RepID=W9YCF6_9EURO|nr:uncharacterized protein A1O3_08305 [Capronia epimyces CBS 606.96]EXJ80019.1 hypothetical protein A1O3_08305 [Capronia epimyces CBS 606.96]
MDHLPLPQNATLGTLDIPYLCTEDYDGEDFETFPARKHWTIERRFTVIVFACRERLVTEHSEVGSFLQTWLYFGLLNQFLEKPVDVKLFQREAGGGKVLFTSKRLGDIISAWTVQTMEQDWSMYENNLRTWKDRLYGYLLTARDIVLRVVHSLDGQPENILSCVCLSIAVLGEYLNYALKDMFIKRGLESPVMQNWQSVDWADCGGPIVTIMQRNGWCPNKLAYFDAEDLKSIGKLWYSANMKPPNAEKSHARCSEEQCQLLQVDLREYRTCHTREGCECASRGPEPGLLASAIQNDLVPLVTIAERAGVKVSLQIADENTEYVAISHVWADGMGNLKENTLTECSLRQLRFYVDALAGFDAQSNLPLWIDTLCLPRNPIELRRRGIIAFNEVFRKAQHVLVLDSYLQKLSSKSMSPIELLARVAVCGWTQRLWTFSEGRLGRSVYFQFEDRAVDLFQAVDQWRETFFRIPSLPSHGVDLAVIGNFSATRILPGPEFDCRLLELPTLRFALGTRSTSWPTDEAICLAGILGLNMRQVIEADDAQKMNVVWSLLQNLPTGLAFSRAPRKLVDKGYRWAPSSLLGDLKVQRWGGPGPLFARLNATPSEAGLIVQLPGALFKARLSTDSGAGRTKLKLFECCLPQFAADRGHLSLQGGSGQWYSCNIISNWHQESADVDIANEVPAIILESPIEMDRSSARDDFRSIDTLRGLLVTYFHSEEGEEIIHAKAHSHVELQTLSNKVQKFHDKVKICCEEILSHNMDTIAALQDDQDTLKRKIASWVEEYAREDDLLELGKEIWRHEMWDDSDGKLINHIVWSVGYLCSVDEWYVIEEGSRPITWCVD